MKRTLREVYKSCLSDLIALQPELFSKKADLTENSSAKQTREKQPPESSAKSPSTTHKNIRIVDVTRLKGRGWVITGVRAPAQLRKERKRHSLQVPVPSVWYGKLWSYTMTFEEAQKALDSEETKQAIALMKEIDKRLGIDAELTSSIYDTPGGASVVIVHDIKTSLDWETLRYLAAIKGKALLKKSSD